MAQDPLLEHYRANRAQDAEFWNNTLANLSQAIFSIPERRARMQQQQQEAELRRGNLELQQQHLGLQQQALQQQQETKQRADQMAQNVSAIMAKSMVKGAKGGYVLDRKTLLANAAQQGIPPEALVPHLEALDKIDASVEKSEKERRGHVVDLLDGLIDSGGSPDAAMLAISYGQKNGWLTDEEVLPIYERLVSDQDILGTAKQMRDTLRGQGEEYTLAEGAARFKGGKQIAVNPKEATQKPPTGLQDKALGFFNRAKNADENIETMETDVSNLGYIGQAWLKAPNVLKTDLGQRYEQARRQMAEAILRRDSGATIKDSEYEDLDRTYFVRPGDTAANIAQKRRARAEALGAMAVGAGPALRNYYGDNSLIEDYRARAAGKGVKAKTTEAPLEFTVEEVKRDAAAAGYSYAEYKAALEAKGHKVVP